MIQDKKAKEILKYSISVLLVVILVRLVDLNQIKSTIAEVNIGIYLTAVAIFFTIYIWSALRWKLLVSSLGYSLNFKNSLKVIMISYGFNKLLPLNSGDLARSKIMARYVNIDSHGEILGATIMERFLDVAFLGLITIIGGFFSIGFRHNTPLIMLFTLMLVLGLGAIQVNSRPFKKILGILETYFLPTEVAKTLSDGLDGFTKVSSSKFLEVLVWQTIRWIAGVSVIYVISISLGLPLSVAEAALITGLMNLVSALPITPAGIGPVETIGTGTLVVLGFSISEAAALIILKRSLGLILMGSIGIIVYSLD